MKPPLSAAFKFKPSLLSFIVTSLAVLLQVLVFNQAQAAGLGKMRVLSALGAPFNAEVELTNVRPEEEGNMAVRIAAPEVFKQAGIDYNPALPAIRATLSGDASNPKIILNSASAINEPLLELLVEMSWQSGRLVRQYTVLLDPINPVNDTTASNEPIQAPVPEVASLVNVASIAANNVNQNTATIPTAALPLSSALTPPRAAQKNSSYDVQRGDTLFGIASRLSGSDGYQVKALMATLLRNNPHAFINNNINRLKAGVVLNADGADAVEDKTLSSNGFSNGRKLTTSNRSSNSNSSTSREFSQYKQAATKAVKPLLDKNPNSKVVKNNVKTDTVAKTPASSDQLKVSGNAAIGNQTLANGGKGSEAQIAKERALAEEKSRIADLEKNIKKSVEIKNSIITTPQASKPESSKLGAPSPVSTSAVASAAGASAAASASTSEVAPSSAVKPNPTTTAGASASVPTTNNVANSSTVAGSASTAPVASPPAANAVKKPPQTTVVPAPEEPSWYENIDPLTLGGAGGIAALLGAWALYRRKKKNEAIAFSDSTFNPKDTQGGLLTAQGGQAVDTFNSVFVSNFSEANMPMESAEVDPVAEADVYMQYGRDAHAEDILVDALKQNPDRHPARLKLMELYASKGNQASLITQFDALSSLTQSSGSEWLAGKKIIDSSKSGLTQTNAAALDVSSTSLNNPNNAVSAISKPFKSTNLAIDNIKLSAPTMIGDVAMRNTGFGLDTAKPMVGAPGSLVSNTPMTDSPTKPSTGIAGLSFDIQSPTVLGRSNVVSSAGSGSSGSSGGLGGVKPAVSATPDSLLEFKVSKMDVAPLASVSAKTVGAKPELKSQASAASLTSNDAQPLSIFDKLSSNSGASATPALETKLSLAKAYADIGDKEGARELLQEVIEAGHQTLSEQAKTVLNKL